MIKIVLFYGSLIDMKRILIFLLCFIFSSLYPVLLPDSSDDQPRVIKPISEPLSQELRWYTTYETSLGNFTVDKLHKLCCSEISVGNLRGPFSILYLEIVRQQDQARRDWWEKIQSKS